jgi:hypothetical protein
VAAEEAADALGLRPHTLNLQQRWTLPSPAILAAVWPVVLAEGAEALAPGAQWEQVSAEDAQWRSVRVTAAAATRELVLEWGHEVRLSVQLSPRRELMHSKILRVWVCLCVHVRVCAGWGRRTTLGSACVRCWIGRSGVRSSNPVGPPATVRESGPPRFHHSHSCT